MCIFFVVSAFLYPIKHVINLNTVNIVGWILCGFWKEVYWFSIEAVSIFTFLLSAAIYSWSKLNKDRRRKVVDVLLNRQWSKSFAHQI